MNELQQFREQTVNEVQQVINSIIVGIDLGNVNPLEAFAVFKKMEKMFDEAKKKIDLLAIEEAEKFGQKSFEYNGQKYEVRDGAKRIDFSNIEEWKIANENLKEIEDKYKKVSLISHAVIDQVTGEILPKPLIKFSKSSLIVK
jgi:hypothetical protein